MREGITITIEDNAIAFGYPLNYNNAPVAGEVITWKGLKLELTEVGYGFSHLKIIGYVLNTHDARNELDMAFAGTQKAMTDAEKVNKLAAAIGRADRFLAEIDAVAEINSIARGAGNRKCSELTQGAVRRARRTLQRALKQTGTGKHTNKTKSARLAGGQETANAKEI